MKEAYVKLKQASKRSGMDICCPIDVEKHEITIGLSLIGFVPEGNEVVGEFDEATDKLNLYGQKRKIKTEREASRTVNRGH